MSEEYCHQCMAPAGSRGCPHGAPPCDKSWGTFCNNEHIAIKWTHPGACPLCASHEEIDRLRTAAEKLHAFINAKGQEYEENALGRTNTQSKTYDEERALVCWQVLDEIEALFQGAGAYGEHDESAATHADLQGLDPHEA